MTSEARAKLDKRIKRISGQIGGVQRMIEEDRYCVDILNQISAIRSALDSLGFELLSNHLESCVIGHGTGSEHARAKPMKPQELTDELKISFVGMLLTPILAGAAMSLSSVSVIANALRLRSARLGNQ